MTAEHATWLFAWVAVNQGGVPIPVVPSLVAAGALAGAGHASLSTLVEGEARHPTGLLHSIETNVARGSTKVSRDVVVRSAFATKARYRRALERSSVLVRTRGHMVWRNGK